MRPYAFTAKEIRPGVAVGLMNGRAWQRGLRNWDWANESSPLTREIAEQVLEDCGYSIDAPLWIPAGGCCGAACLPDYSAPIQSTTQREAAA